MLGEVAARLRVRVWSDDPLSGVGITTLLRDVASVQLVDDGEDVLVVAPRDEVNEALAALCVPPPAWILVAGPLDEGSLLAAVEAGLGGVVSRDEVSGTTLCAAIAAAFDGCGPLPAELGALLLASLGRMRQDPDGHGAAWGALTGREADVLRLVAEGWSTTEVASKLSYSERTIKEVIGRIVHRWHARNRTHAVTLAVRRGLI